MSNNNSSEPHYHSHMWDQFSTICGRATRGKQSLDQILTFVKRKAALDMYYSTALKGLMESCELGENEVNGGTLQNFLQNLSSLFINVAENHEICAAKLIENVQKPVERLRNKVSQVSETLMKTGSKLHDENERINKSLNASELECEKLCRQFQAAKRAAVAADELDRNRSESNDMFRHIDHNNTQMNVFKENLKNTKLKARNLYKQAIAADHTYTAEVSKARSFHEIFDEKAVKILRQLEEVERRRTKSITTYLKKLMETQQSLFENLDTSISQMAGKIDDINTEADLRHYICSNMKLKPHLPAPIYKRSAYHPLQEHVPSNNNGNDIESEASSSSSGHSFVVVDDNDNDDDDDEQHISYDKLAAEYLTRLFNGKYKYEPIADNIKKLNDIEIENKLIEMFQHENGRDSFVHVLNQSRTLNALHLNKDAFNKLGKILNKFLDNAAKERHIRPTQLIMIMSQTMFYLPSDDKAQDSKIFLQTLIRDHEIWKDMRLWEEQFYSGYSNELQKLVPLEPWRSDAEQADHLEKQRNILFSQLAAFAHNMMEFGIDHSIVQSFLEKQAIMNDLKKEHKDMLLNMPSLNDKSELP